MQAVEEIYGIALDAWSRFTVEVELDFAPMQIAPAAGEPEVVDAAGTVFLEDDVLAFVVYVQLRVGSSKAIVVAACSVVAGQVV